MIVPATSSGPSCGPERRLPIGTAARDRADLPHDMVATMLRLAASHYAAGRLMEAASACGTVLAGDPRNRDALRILGAIHGRQGQHAEAAGLFEQVLKIAPGDPETLRNLGVTLIELGRWPEAVERLKAAVKLKKDWADAHFSLATAFRHLGRLADAAGHLEKAAKLQPAVAAIHIDLGVVRLLQGHSAAAAASFRTALRLDPENAALHVNLGTALRQLGNRTEAADSFRAAIRRQPGFSEAHCSLGDTLLDLGRSEEELAAYRHALAVKPDFPEVLNSSGTAELALGSIERSERCLLRALAARPDYAAPHVNIGLLRLSDGQIGEAARRFRRAVALSPEHTDALNDLGIALQTGGRTEEAIRLHRRALHVDPQHEAAHGNIVFALDLLPGIGFAEHQAERRRWYLRHGRRHAAAIRPHTNLRDPERRLRVGYVSADFRAHSAANLFGPMLLHHDRTQVAVVCYSGVVHEDDRTRTFRAASDLWRSTIGLTADALADQIREDAVDILVDLSGYSAGHKLPVFARKPAPVQVTGFGYGTGTGLPTIDYFFADPVVVPAEARPLFAEAIYDLPCFIPFEVPAGVPAVSPSPAAAGAPFTFGSFNRIAKITDGVLATWGRILAARPDARLLMKDSALDDEDVRRRLLAAFGRHGVDLARIELRGRTGRAEHLAAMGEADITLDPFPNNGGVTTFESILMGVPVIALVAQSAPGRSSASILTALSLPDWLAGNEDAYVTLATERAAEVATLAELRGTLRQRLSASVVADLGSYTRLVEAGYRHIWRKWCAPGMAPTGRDQIRSRRGK
ncbi:MAG: tetratricopeptide repeat protein [Alphaproteobacteria bacterium]|nr:tetratricopeptide repeat protein [Alphaproteobacteria bacterium]